MNQKTKEGLINQIEALQMALTKRNRRIVELENQVKQLEKRKTQTHLEARREAWYEGWKHESDYLINFGQFCPTKECNPYAGDPTN